MNMNKIIGSKKVTTNEGPDLRHIEFDSDGVVRMALNRKETQRKLWDSIQQFANIAVASGKKS
tara:strand:- start:261 stop:449 length:189 start_codon:yes stop_codon:yes gene_type:complete